MNNPDIRIAILQKARQLKELLNLSDYESTDFSINAVREGLEWLIFSIEGDVGEKCPICGGSGEIERGDGAWDFGLPLDDCPRCSN